MIRIVSGAASFVLSLLLVPCLLAAAGAAGGETVYRADFSAGADRWVPGVDGGPAPVVEGGRLVFEQPGFERMAAVREMPAAALVPGREYRLSYRVRAENVQRRPRVAESGAGLRLRRRAAPGGDDAAPGFVLNESALLAGSGSAAGALSFTVPDDWRDAPVVLCAGLYEASGRFEIEEIVIERAPGALPAPAMPPPAGNAAWSMPLGDFRAGTDGWSYNRPLSSGPYEFFHDRGRLVIDCPETATASFIYGVSGHRVVPGAEYRVSYLAHAVGVIGDPDSFDSGGNIYAWLMDRPPGHEGRRLFFFNNCLLFEGNKTMAGEFTFRVPDDYTGRINVWARIYRAAGRLEVESVRLEKLRGLTGSAD